MFLNFHNIDILIDVTINKMSTIWQLSNTEWGKHVQNTVNKLFYWYNELFPLQMGKHSKTFQY
jgi:hypothetical protein